MESIFVAATWFDVIALCMAVGAALCVLWVVPRADHEVFARGLRRGFASALALLTVSSVVLAVTRTLEMSGAGWSGVGHFLPLVVAHTHFGLLWQVRIIAIGAAWLAGISYVYNGRAAVAGALGLLAASMVIAYTRAASGHAGDAGPFAPAVWVDTAHLLAAGAWVGPLFIFSTVVFPTLRRVCVAPAQLAVGLFERLSTLAGAALAMVVASGFYSAWRGLGGVAALWRTSYGQILLVKISLVAAMVAIGAHNRYVKRPTLRRTAGGPAGVVWTAHAARAVLLEAVLALGVLLAAASLHHTMPPSDHPAGMQMLGRVPAPTKLDVPAVDAVRRWAT
ncbi:MAG: hypothetical protein B7Z66_03940 [Chromatiales bacterium 21-64-14]|nr:MAG: hypothetical protein B7Z66_03940 [Chromatiales bacterium 21-64-14]HQU14769.1 CopD family protein [Gammaproteobacteria bacterium]